MADNGFRPRAGSAPVGTPARAAVPRQAFDLRGLAVPAAQAPSIDVLGAIRERFRASVDDLGQVSLGRRAVSVVPLSRDAESKAEILRLVRQEAARQVDIRAREALAGPELDALLGRLDGHGAPTTEAEFHRLASSAVRAAVACHQEAPPEFGTQADVASVLAVERLKHVVSKLSVYLVRHRAGPADFKANDVLALVAGAVTAPGDGLSLNAAKQARNLSALLQALLPTANASPAVLPHIRQALATQALLAPSPARWAQYMSTVLERRLMLLGQRPTGSSSEPDWPSLLRSAPSRSLPRLGERLAAAVHAWPAPQVHARIHAWMSRWQYSGGPEGCQRQVSAADLANSLGYLLRHVNKDCGASRVAALVRGWFSVVPAECREEVYGRVKKMLDRAPRERVVPPGTEKKQQAQEKSPSRCWRLVVLAALGRATDADLEDPFTPQRDKLAVSHRFTRSKVREDRTAFNAAVVRFMTTESPGVSPEDRLAVLADACLGRSLELNPPVAQKMFEFVQGQIKALQASRPVRAQEWRVLFEAEKRLLESASLPAYEAPPPTYEQAERENTILPEVAELLVDDEVPPPPPLGLDHKHSGGREQDAPFETPSPFIPGRLPSSLMLVDHVQETHRAPIGRERKASISSDEVPGAVLVETKRNGSRWVSPESLAILSQGTSASPSRLRTKKVPSRPPPRTPLPPPPDGSPPLRATPAAFPAIEERQAAVVSSDVSTPVRHRTVRVSTRTPRG